jgi:L-amino acid N-acyltransferase YncA
VTRLRLATEEDIPTLVEMAAVMHATSSFAPLAYSPEKMAQSLAQGIRTAFVAVSVDDADGAITGAIFGDVVAPCYSTDRMGVEIGIYVSPERRGGRGALMLVAAWVRWCVASGAKQIRPGTAATSPAADRLYRGLGFEPVGQLYVMNERDFP